VYRFKKKKTPVCGCICTAFYTDVSDSILMRRKAMKSFSGRFYRRVAGDAVELPAVSV